MRRELAPCEVPLVFAVAGDVLVHEDTQGVGRGLVNPSLRDDPPRAGEELVGAVEDEVGLRGEVLGHQVTIVELGPGPKRGGTPVDIRDETIGVVDRMGLLDAVRAKALPPRATVFTTLDGTVLARSEPEPPPPDASGDGYEIHRDDLLDILLAATEGDVEMLWNSSVDDLTDVGDGVRASFRDGTVRDFDLMPGCDGAHSTVRRLWFGPESDYSHFLETYFSVAVVDESFVAPATSLPRSTVIHPMKVANSGGTTSIP